MSKINSAQDLKAFYLNTDITDLSAVQNAIHTLNEAEDIAGKPRYLGALHSAVPATIAKARKYETLSQSWFRKNLGWIIMGIFGVLMGVIDSGYEDSITTWLSLGFWVGVGVQIYTATLKSAWKMLTLEGSVIHPALKVGFSSVQAASKKAVTEQPIAKNPASSVGDSIICECGYKNKQNAKFCENCGTKL